jgi:hypothetical protein
VICRAEVRKKGLGKRAEAADYSRRYLANDCQAEWAARARNPNASANELKTTLMSHSIIHGDAYFAYFNKIWGIP